MRLAMLSSSPRSPSTCGDTQGIGRVLATRRRWKHTRQRQWGYQPLRFGQPALLLIDRSLQPHLRRGNQSKAIRAIMV